MRAGVKGEIMMSVKHNEMARGGSRITKYILAAIIITTVFAAVSLAAVIFIAVSTRNAEAESLPSGKEVCERYVKVTGGRKAYDKIDTRVTRGKFAMPAQGLVMSLTTYTRRPDFMRAVIESDMVGKIERGVVDGVAWENSMMSGPVIKEGAERDQMVNGAIFNKMAEWRKAYKSVECTADTMIGGTGCYEVVMTPVMGSEETSYFDKDTGLILISKTIVHSQMGSIPTEVHLSDYREVDGIKIAFKSTVKVMGQTREITIESVEHNTEIPEEYLELPDEIQSLMKKKNQKEEMKKE